jgi:cytidyltransferase-like protein
MVCNLIASGGTFDHFHKGHKKFLSYGLSVGKNLLIGITSDTYVANLKSKVLNVKQIEPYAVRKKSVIDFLKNLNVLHRYRIVSIDDVFGPTLSKDFSIDGIVVSKETEGNVDIINRERFRLSLNPLKKYIAPQFFSEDHKLLSSARIRSGEVNRQGELYIKPLWLKKDLLLPDDLRNELKKPFGEIVKSIDNISGAPLVITVGDETSKYFNLKGQNQNISVVDFKVRRKTLFSSFSDLSFSKQELIVNINNPAGHLTKEAFVEVMRAIKSGSEKKIILKIEGEDDLLVIPLMLASPLNSLIYYGQPDKGLVKILVSEKNKNTAYDLASKFKPIETYTRGY